MVDDSVQVLTKSVYDAAVTTKLSLNAVNSKLQSIENNFKQSEYLMASNLNNTKINLNNLINKNNNLINSFDLNSILQNSKKSLSTLDTLLLPSNKELQSLYAEGSERINDLQREVLESSRRALSGMAVSAKISDSSVSLGQKGSVVDRAERIHLMQSNGIIKEELEKLEEFNLNLIKLIKMKLHKPPDLHSKIHSAKLSTASAVNRAERILKYFPKSSQGRDREIVQVKSDLRDASWSEGEAVRAIHPVGKVEIGRAALVKQLAEISNLNNKLLNIIDKNKIIEINQKISNDLISHSSMTPILLHRMHSINFL